MDLTYQDDDFCGGYSRSQSLECSACVLEAHSECRECEETLYHHGVESCRECVEYGRTRGEEEYQEEYQEMKVSCFTCAPKTKKFSNEDKKTKRASKRKEAGKLKTMSIEEETTA